MKKIIKFFKTLNFLTIKSCYDSRLRGGMVFGRPWTPLRFSARFFPFWFGRYNYNNILLHAKGISASEDMKISDSGTFNFTRYLEKKLLQRIVQILNLPFSTFSGYVTSGATEANIYAMWIAREWAWELKGNKNYWIIPDNAHYSIAKALRLLGVYDSGNNEIIDIKTDSLGEASYEEIAEHIKKIRDNSNDPIILPLTVMTTECGAIDPVKEIDKFIIDSKFNNIFFHVDAAFSGFLLPFLEESKDVFSIKSLYSISVDFSKTIGGPVASGAIIFRPGLEEHVITHAPYLSDSADQTLSGSRKGADVIAMYSILSINDASDIKKDILNAIEKARFLAKAISTNSSIKLLYDSTLNYIVFYLTNTSKDKEEKIRKVLKSYAISSSMVKISGIEKEIFKIITRKDHSYKNINKLVSNLKSCN